MNTNQKFTDKALAIAQARRDYHAAIAPHWQEYCAATPVGAVPGPGVLEKYKAECARHVVIFDMAFKDNYVTD